MPPPDRKPHQGDPAAALVFLLPWIAGAAAVMIGLRWPIDEGAVWLQSLCISLPSFVILYGLLSLRRRITPGWLALGLASSVFYVIAGALLAYAVNARFDRSERSEHVVEVLSTDSRGHGKNSSYHAVVTGWDAEEPRRDIRIAAKVHRALERNPGAKLRLRIGAGALGHLWIEDATVLAPKELTNRGRTTDGLQIEPP